MDPIEDATPRRVVAQLASHPWEDRQIAELVAPRFGIITGFVAFDGESEAAGNALTRQTTFFNMTGNPALSVPSGLHSSGLPMGVQLIGGFRVPLPDL